MIRQRLLRKLSVRLQLIILLLLSWCSPLFVKRIIPQLIKNVNTYFMWILPLATCSAVWYNIFGAVAPLGVCQALFVGHVHLICVTPPTKVSQRFGAGAPVVVRRRFWWWAAPIIQYVSDICQVFYVNCQKLNKVWSVSAQWRRVVARRCTEMVPAPVVARRCFLNMPQAPTSSSTTMNMVPSADYSTPAAGLSSTFED